MASVSVSCSLAGDPDRPGSMPLAPPSFEVIVSASEPLKLVLPF
jgi:hypothetical protein